MDTSDLKQYCQDIPKLELHAHLNTSYSYDTLHQLIVLNGGTVTEKDMEAWHIASLQHLDEHFKFFKRIQQLVRTEESVYLLTRKVIEEFAADNVKYLELRSTPKSIPETGMTSELYMRTMIQAVQDLEREGLDIAVRLLPSIDRRLGLTVAQETVELAEKLMRESNGIVIGIDLSGDPTVGKLGDYIPIFLDASKRGLKLALHLAEVSSFEETDEVLRKCAPHGTIRIGHGTFINRFGKDLKHSQLEDFVTERKIPIETCMTSNLLGGTVESLEDHHFKYWLDKKHPVIICTDGKGVYNSLLSHEYEVAAKAYAITKDDLQAYVLSTIDSIFETQTFKDNLREKFNKHFNELKN